MSHSSPPISAPQQPAGPTTVRRGRHRTLTVALATLLVLAVASPAWADATVGTTGASAFWDSSANRMDVSDTRADSQSVYVDFCFTNNAEQASCGSPGRVANTQGSGTTESYILGPTGTFIIFKVCRDILFAPDDCSSWVNTES